jgi:hypothetical protein
LPIGLDSYQSDRVGPRAGTFHGGQRFRSEGIGAEVMSMGRGLLLWLIGIPLPIILIIWLLGGLS